MCSQITHVEILLRRVDWNENFNGPSISEQIIISRRSRVHNAPASGYRTRFAFFRGGVKSQKKKRRPNITRKSSFRRPYKQFVNYLDCCNKFRGRFPFSEKIVLRRRQIKIPIHYCYARTICILIGNIYSCTALPGLSVTAVVRAGRNSRGDRILYSLTRLSGVHARAHDNISPFGFA